MLLSQAYNGVMIIGITGTNGAGKGEVVRYLVEEKGFTHFSVRDEITAEIERRGLVVDRPNMNEVGTDLRATHGADYFTKLFVQKAKEQGLNNIVIESIRSPYEAAAIHEAGGKVIVVDADLETRYYRVVTRGSDTDKVSFEEFCAQQEREMTSEDPTNPAKMDIRAVIEQADVHLQNNGLLQDLYTEIDAALTTLS
jgi:dephospho-CoA kinase